MANALTEVLLLADRAFTYWKQTEELSIHQLVRVALEGSDELATMLSSAGLSVTALDVVTHRPQAKLGETPTSNQMDVDCWRRVCSAVGLVHGSGSRVPTPVALGVSWIFLPWPMRRDVLDTLGLDLPRVRLAIDSAYGDLGLDDIEPRTWSPWVKGVELQPGIEGVYRDGRTTSGERFVSRLLD